MKDEDYGYDDDRILEVLIAKYGKKKGTDYFDKFTDLMVGKSWECRDCACLDEFEYFDKLAEVPRTRQAPGNHAAPKTATDSGKRKDVEESEQ
jgi:hypothetical protein